MLSGIITNLEMRFTPTGRALCILDLVPDHGINSSLPIRCVAWESIAEKIVNLHDNGERISVTGFFKDRKWKDRNGKWHTASEYTIKDILPGRIGLNHAD